MDFYTFVVQLVVALPPLVLALVTWRKVHNIRADVQHVHLLVNSRIDQLLQATRDANIAIGRKQVHTEQAAERASQNNPSLSP